MTTTMQQYLDHPAVSAGVLRTLLDRCPLAAWSESWLNPQRVNDTTPESDAGTIAHAIVLEGGSRNIVEVVDPQDHPAEKTGNIPDGWTNKSIRAARDAARERGKIPVLLPEMARIDRMAESALTFIDMLKTDEPAVYAAFQEGQGKSECTMLWDDDGVPCKIRPDRIAMDRGVIVDLKFTAISANPETYGRTLIMGNGAFVGAAFYRRGVRVVTGVTPSYLYLVTESEPPYLSSLIGLDPRAVELGDQRIVTALREWRWCQQAARWPAYPTRACYPEVPPWIEARYLEQEVSGFPYDPAKLFERTA